jgi:hypothetical protein
VNPSASCNELVGFPDKQPESQQEITPFMGVSRLFEFFRRRFKFGKKL